MPGPGHEHSAKFERCLKHVKQNVPAGRDPDEYSHRVCYTSVGKSVMDWLEKQDEREYSAPSTAAPPATVKSPEKDEELAGIIKDLLSSITGSDADIQATSSDLEPKDRPAGANETPSDGVSMTKGSHIHLEHFQLIKTAKKGKRWFEGWGSVEVKDKQGDIIPSDELEPLLPLLRKRYNRFFDSHTDLMLGEFTEFDIRDKEVEISDDEGNVTKEMRSGLWFKGFFYEDYAFQKEAWEKFKNGEYGGFSLRGGATGMKMACADDACTNMLRVPTGVEIAAFSIVRSPANPEATPEKVNMMAKSAYASEDVSKAASEIVEALKKVWSGPYKGKRGGTYMLDPSGRKVYDKSKWRGGGKRRQEAAAKEPRNPVGGGFKPKLKPKPRPKPKEEDEDKKRRKREEREAWEPGGHGHLLTRSDSPLADLIKEIVEAIRKQRAIVKLPRHSPAHR